ncbi:MAG: hypothetical protein Q8N30_08165 [Methylococcales bacterium]|nr:hypothetical protein [Methylococcales bacterium]
MFTETRGQKRDREAFLAGDADKLKQKDFNWNVAAEKVKEWYKEKSDFGIDNGKLDAGKAAMYLKDYHYPNANYDDLFLVSVEALNKLSSDWGFKDKNLEVLNDVRNGRYDSETSEDLLNRIETAANAIDTDKYNDLISKAMDKWLEVDNGLYLLDSVYSYGDTSGIVGWFDNTDFEPDYAYDIDENEGILDAARRLKFNKKTDHWVTTETGSHLMIRGGKVVGGAGGKLNGMTGESRSKHILNGHTAADVINAIRNNTEIKDAWNASVDEVKSMPEKDFRRLIDGLDNVKYHHEGKLLEAKRNGNPKLIKFAEDTVKLHSDAVDSEHSVSRNNKLQESNVRHDALMYALKGDGKKAVSDRMDKANELIKEGRRVDSQKSMVHHLKKVSALLDSINDDDDPDTSGIVGWFDNSEVA